MPRPREFDRDDVLFEALRVFWRLGYEACSLQHLVEATGVNRQSLYNVFNDKRGLFLAVLERYRERIATDLQRLQSSEASLEDLRRYMELALDAQRRIGAGACLLVITSFGPACEDPEVRAAVRAGATLVRTAFEALLERCIADGSAAPSLDAKTTAATLYTVLNGLSALTRTGGTKAQRTAVLDQTFDALAA